MGGRVLASWIAVALVSTVGTGAWAESGPPPATGGSEVLQPYPTGAPQPAPYAAPQPVPQPYPQPPPYQPPAPYPPPPPPVYYAPPPTNYYAPPAAYWPPTPAPVYHDETRPRWGLFTAGLVIFGISWTTNAMTAYFADSGYLAIPLVGPIVVAKQYSDSHPSCSNSSGYCYDTAGTKMAVTGLVFDALIQAGGLVMTIAGAVTKHRVRVPGSSKVSVLPSAQSGGAGLVAFGRF